MCVWERVKHGLVGVLAILIGVTTANNDFATSVNNDDTSSRSRWFASAPCGQSKYYDAGEEQGLYQTRVVGGISTRPHEYPWQVYLEIRKRGSIYFCGGSVINNRWILTAGHCMNGATASDVKVFVGGHSKRQTEAREYPVGDVITHEGYGSARGVPMSDIALIRLQAELELSEDVQPVCAPDPNDIYAHRRAVATGWGLTGDDDFPADLQAATFNITTNQFCTDAHSAPVYSDNICTGDNQGSHNRDTCGGDSGGPLVVKEGNGQFVIVGFTSWGSVPCADGYPGVYVRVTSYLDWMGDVMASY